MPVASAIASPARPWTFSTLVAEWFNCHPLRRRRLVGGDWYTPQDLQIHITAVCLDGRSVELEWLEVLGLVELAEEVVVEALEEKAWEVSGLADSKRVVAFD